MHPDLLAMLANERRREVRLEYARCGPGRKIVRRTVARLLRACGDLLFRLGVTLDDVRA